MTLKSKFFYNFVKYSYNQIFETVNEEEVYYKENKLVVVVNNKEIGQQIYDIVKDLADREETISTWKIDFKISKYFADKQNTIEIFCVDVNSNDVDINFDFKKEWSRYSKLEKLQEVSSFVDDIQNKRYILDESKFKNENCNCISAFLSFFILDNEKVESSKGCLIKYIHYVLSDGGNLEEFYKKIVSNNMICKMQEFPYSLPIIKMCYNYFVTGTIPESICGVLQEEIEGDEFSDSYKFSSIVSNANLDLATIENNEDYTIYDGNIKIYHDMSSEFEYFLNANTETLIDGIEQVGEQLEQIIRDFTGKIIGYKFSIKNGEFRNTIFEQNFKTQHELLDFMFKISKYLDGIIQKHYYGSPIIYIGSNESDNFNIEESLVCIDDDNLSITGTEEFFNLLSNNRDMFENKITTIFFKLYLEYLNNKYGKMFTEEEFFEKMEVRCLSPILTREFINYALGKQVDYNIATEEFIDFLYNTKRSSTFVNNYCFYDSRYEYNPFNTPFIFEDEVEKKYEIKLNKGLYETLPDGRRLITFNRKKKISTIKKKEDSLRKEISKKLGDIEDENVKIIGISEIIYSKNIDNDNMYKVVGYVTEPINGKRLTDEVLVNLNNKDLLKVFGYLFTKFKNNYISWDTIWMEDNFTFYINILDKNFHIEKSGTPFMNWITDYLIEKGCNPNAFIDLDFSESYIHKYVFIGIANFYDAYCNEHNIYYDSNDKMCPACRRTKYFLPQDYEKNARKLFEDAYAEHYSIDEQYNLKVYKTSCIDIDEIERNIDKIIRKQLDSKNLKLGQDCFVPYKKAITDNSKFVGYIYKAVEFNNKQGGTDICIDLKDSQRLSNLPRLMSLIRLILQVKEITNNNLGFINNPFTYVFLGKAHKKQVQILNVELLSKRGNIKDTIKWTCEYVCQVLASDTSIEVDISDCSTDIDSLLEKLQNLSKELTKYCSIHKMYYKKDNLFCPKCLDKSILESIEIEYVQKSTIIKQDLITEGGESFIYPYNDDSVAKVFKDKEVNYDFKNVIISRILDRKETLERFNKKDFKYKYVLIEKLLVDTKTNSIFGYTMKRVTGKPLSILRDREEVEKLGIAMKDVFEILITAGEGIETLHTEANIFIGDLNGCNILFDTQKNVYFLDFDGMGIDELAPVFFTDGYIDPLSKKNHNITKNDDWYSFAIQAFHYLTFTHPFNGIYSIEEDGKEMLLEIPDKMERRISLLGNHGMEAPDVALSWNWMNEELKTVFLDIFEGDNRESIIPYLICQYKELYGSDPNQESNKIIRVNSKFIAKEINPFNSDVVHIINHYAAVCSENDEYYVSVLLNKDRRKIEYNIYLTECMKIKNVLLSEDKMIAIAIYEKEIVVFDLEKNSEIYSEEISNVKDIVLDDTVLYFSGISDDGENIIFQRNFIPDGGVQKDEIKFLTKQSTKRFLAFNSKFVLVKSDSEHVDKIYCNSQRLCDMSCKSENSKYNIIYDETTKLWLVVNSEGNGIIINSSNGKCKKIDIKKCVNDINVGNIGFNNGIVYIPCQDYLYIVNTNGEVTTKKMECNRIMTPNSQLYNINKIGFSVMTDDVLYEVRRG